jgi:outer membrane lipoprotein-sorting protein
MKQRGFFLLFLVLGLAILGCQAARVPPAPTAETPGESGILALFQSREERLKGLQGVADLKLSSPAGPYHGKEILSVELPNRFRVESVNFMGFSDLVLCSDSGELDLYLPSEGKIIRARLMAEGLAEISGVKIPIPQMLRIFMGLPPFPVDGKIAASICLGKSREPLWEQKGAGDLQQRLWIDERAGTVREGEVLDGGVLWFSYRFADYREVTGFLIPFALEIRMQEAGAEIFLSYRDITLNPVIEEETFRLILPSLEGLTIIDVESRENSEDLPG